MFVDKQIQVLKYDIEPSRIKSRSKGNINLSYLEGFDLIETANKIFGHGNWSYSITSLDQVSQETNTNQNVVICYKALVKLSVYSLRPLQAYFKRRCWVWYRDSQDFGRCTRRWSEGSRHGCVEEIDA